MRTEVPVAWATRWPRVPAKWVLERVERPPAATDGIITAFRDGQVTLRSERRTEGFTNAVQEIGYQGIRRGDLVIHGMDAFAGTVGVSDSDGKASPVVHAYVSRGEADMRYYSYLLRMLAWSGFIVSLAKGIRERSSAFDAATFQSLVLPAPPLLEQRGIADFLDGETARIDALIARKRRLIELLDERRVAATTAMVSGSEERALTATESDWFPRLPEGWRVSSVGEVTTAILDGPHVSPAYLDEGEGGIPFISVRNISVSGWDLTTAKYISKDDYRRLCHRVRPEKGDVLLTKGGNTGIARVVDLDFDFHVWVHVAILKTRRQVVSPEYLAAVLNSWPGYQQSQLGTRGATNQDLALGRIAKIRISLPPLGVQEQIAHEIGLATARLHQVQADLTKQIDLLVEHRQAIVTAAVTGELDIPGVAA